MQPIGMAHTYMSDSALKKHWTMVSFNRGLLQSVCCSIIKYSSGLVKVVHWLDLQKIDVNVMVRL